jgi:hypothetical protein
LLVSHIRSSLPTISSDVAKLLTEKGAELEALRESADPCAAP